MPVQVDPIKPKLKAPGTKRLKLNCHELLSTVAFNFNLHRYIMAAEMRITVAPLADQRFGNSGGKPLSLRLRVPAWLGVH
jgi:hypothetical protein